MYKLFAAPGRASMAPEAILEQIGAPYEYLHLEPMAARQDAEYRRLNPLGQIPTLVDDGQAIYESAAICLYLSERHPEAGLLPPVGTPDRGKCYQWLFFFSNTVQPTYMQFFYPDRYLSLPDAAPQLSRDAAGRIPALWRQIDAAIGDRKWLVGEQASAADVYLYMLAQWHRPAILPLTELSGVTRMLRAAGELAGVCKMMVRNEGH
jgi:glutathione S-transferase